MDAGTVLAEKTRVVPFAYCPNPYLSPAFVYCFTTISPGSFDVIWTPFEPPGTSNIPDVLILPATSSLAEGFDKPIPTFPSTCVI